MILLDSNILMYAAGAPHPHKADSLALLERVARGEIEAAVDAEVLQAQAQCYTRVKNILIPNMYYRDDIGERWAEDSDRLHNWGYLR